MAKKGIIIKQKSSEQKTQEELKEMKNKRQIIKALKGRYIKKN